MLRREPCKSLEFETATSLADAMQYVGIQGLPAVFEKAPVGPVPPVQLISQGYATLLLNCWVDHNVVILGGFKPAAKLYSPKNCSVRSSCSLFRTGLEVFTRSLQIIGTKPQNPLFLTQALRF